MLLQAVMMAMWMSPCIKLQAAQTLNTLNYAVGDCVTILAVL